VAELPVDNKEMMLQKLNGPRSYAQNRVIEHAENIYANKFFALRYRFLSL